MPERFASIWPELIIAYDVRGHGEWLHHCSWLPLQLACTAYALPTHSNYRQRSDITTGLHIASFAFTGGGRKIRLTFVSFMAWCVIVIYQ